MKRVLPCVAPNLPVLLLAVVGFVAETTMFGFVRDNVFQYGLLFAGFAVLALVWIWFSTAWVMWVAARAVAAGSARRPVWQQAAAHCVVIVVVAVPLIAYLASWGMYLQSGRFANIEMLRFAWQYPDWLLIYLRQAEGRQLTALVGLAVAALAGLLVFARWMAHAVWPWPAPSHARRTRRTLWCATAVGWMGLFVVVLKDESQLRCNPRLECFRHRFHPEISLYTSWHESTTDEKIEPCLDVAELIPLRHQAYTPPAATLRNRPSIIFLAMESMRADVVLLNHQSQEVMPQLNTLARTGVHFTRAYSQTTHTDYSNVSLFSSLYPLRMRWHHYYQSSDPWPRTLIYDLLKPAGYATAIISSQNESWGGMDKFFLTPNLDWLYDAERDSAMARVAEPDSSFGIEQKEGVLHGGILDDAHTTDVAIDWIKKQHAKGVPFFLGLNYQASHFPYELPAGRPHPFEPSTVDFRISFTGYPVERTEVLRNCYYNALHDCDVQLGRLVTALRELGQLDNTILVVYGDHGEAFHEHGQVTHAKEPIEPTVHSACVLYAPGFLGPRTEDYPVEFVDIVPTVLGLMDWPSHPNFQGTNVLATNRPPADQRLLFMHAENGLVRSDTVLLGGRWKFWHDRHAQREYLFDLSKDHNEESNLIEQTPDLAQSLQDTLAT